MACSFIQDALNMMRGSRNGFARRVRRQVVGGAGRQCGNDVIFPKVEMCLVTWVVGSAEGAIKIISTPGPSFKFWCPLDAYTPLHTKRERLQVTEGKPR